MIRFDLRIIIEIAPMLQSPYAHIWIMLKNLGFINMLEV